MAFKTAELVLAADVADDGTVTGIAYPTGTNQAFFTSDNASATGAAVVNNNDVYLETASAVGLAYGDTTITLTNKSDVTWPAGSSVVVQFGYAAADEVTVIAQPAEAALTGTLTGSVDGAMADIAALDTSDAYTDAAVNVAITSANLQLKELQTKLNAVITKLVAAGVLSST